MFSNHAEGRRRAVALRLLACAVLVAISSAGCGKRGDPLPPLRSIPLKTSDLEVGQQGRQILLNMTYPKTTVSGMALGGIDAVELLEYVRPALPEGETPTVESSEFDALAQPLVTLRGAELDAAVTGDKIEFRLPLADPLPEEPATHFFAVRTTRGEETSALSNRVSLLPIEPPPAPSQLQAEPEAGGIRLSWQSEPEVEGFDIFRREAQNRAFGDAIRRVPGASREYLDTSAEYGRRYIYTVRSVAKVDPLIHSSEAGEREIDYEDRFPPPLPENFVALAERGTVRLRWDPSLAADVAGYLIYRREPGRDFHLVTDDPVQGVEYVDRGLVAGFTYDYRIQVVDKVGNRGELSRPISATLR